MGGRALSCGSIRMDPAMYHLMCEAVLHDLEDCAVFEKCDVIPSYRDKESYGDIDILCLDYLKFAEINDLLSKIFGAREIVENGNVLSFDLRKVYGQHLSDTGPAIQVDLILANNLSEYEFSLKYHAYNDMGNLLGVMAKNMGFKLGHNGLFYKYTEGTTLHKEILVTDEFSEAMLFLGYSLSDTEEYARGFNTLGDIFAFVSNSVYFNKHVYSLDTRSSKSRARDKKRPTYMAFLEWLRRHEILDVEVFSERFHLNRALPLCPTFKNEYSNCIREVFSKKHIKSVFNGGWVNQVTGLEGEALGVFMTRIKNSYGSNVLFEEAVLFNPAEVRTRVVALKDAPTYRASMLINEEEDGTLTYSWESWA